ncbi:glutaredoxin-like protein [Gordonia iterans]|uniref:Glutaredoxin-like protein n=1 Tax=Gordonia iterans TaxID=1004901 RepID=A0A2S0KIA7_9ACTN|nr:mycoredoxin [Gordonia iterans]AVM01422.1 glutaredoxin-like protein [Gordonia iterans]
MAGMASLTVYTTSWCPFCVRLKRSLTLQNVDFTEIDVEADADAAAFVESVNGGDRVVPTVKYDDGSTQTNPGIGEVLAKLGR